MVPLQVLPFASDETLKILEENLGSLPAITDLLHMGFSAGQLTNAILGTLTLTFNHFRCPTRSRIFSRPYSLWMVGGR